MEFEGIKLAVTGAGRWGLNHIKTANGLLGGGLKYVCDVSEGIGDRLKEEGLVEQGEQAKQGELAKQGESATADLRQEQRKQGKVIKTKFTTDFEEVINDKEVNAVIIATSAKTHFELAKKALKAGKNVLVEKPITLVTKEARELLEIAEERGLKLMVGHILLYHPAILKIKEMISAGKLGKLQYVYSNRLNLGAIRTEENILWSFAPHDISVIQFLTEKNPIKIKATGAKFVQENIEDTTLTILEYPGNVHAHIFVSWLHPFKEQRLVVIGSDGMLTFEDTLKTEKLKFFKKGFKILKGNIEKFDSEYEAVEFDNTQPLAEEQKHFFDCIINNTQPRTDGKHALEVLKILEKAAEQLRAVRR